MSFLNEFRAAGFQVVTLLKASRNQRTKNIQVLAAEVRDALTLGRKVLIMVLEAMDGQKLTLRDGEVRRLAKK